MLRTFPSSGFRIERKAQPLIMPACRTALAEGDSDSPWIAVDAEFAAQRADLYQGVRLMVLAVLNLFGGHRPTRGDDPHGGAARPWKMERLDAISRQRQASRAFERRPPSPENAPYAAAA